MDYICDIDGTIADVRHRRHLVQTRPSNWPAFRAAAAFDPPILPVIRTLQALAYGPNRILLCSGRMFDEHDLTVAWLTKHRVPYARLYMRASVDYRPDEIVKSELLDQMLEEGYQPIMVFDDRNKVVAMWRARGLVCAQVAEGDF